MFLMSADIEVSCGTEKGSFTDGNRESICKTTFVYLKAFALLSYSMYA